MALPKFSVAEYLPLDVIPLILEHLTDRRDLHTCARVSKAFYHATTPLLYRTLDVRVTDYNNKVRVFIRILETGCSDPFLLSASALWCCTHPRRFSRGRNTRNTCGMSERTV